MRIIVKVKYLSFIWKRRPRLCKTVYFHLNMFLFFIFQKKMISAKLESLPAELQISRESALLGNYDMALVYFDTILQTIAQ
jgi:hypothetical protein